MAQSNYLQWQLTPPPATRFFQLASGDFSLYFERSRINEMIQWAEKQAEAFRHMAQFEAQKEALETQTKPQPKPQQPKPAPKPAPKPTQAKPAAPANAPKAPVAAPKTPVAAPPAAVAAPPTAVASTQVAMGAIGLRPSQKGRPPAPGFPSINGVPLTTQAEAKAAVPELPKPPSLKVDDVAEMDPGLRIALEQQRMIDARNGVDREKKNNAPEEPETPEAPAETIAEGVGDVATTAVVTTVAEPVAAEVVPPETTEGRIVQISEVEQ